MYFGGPAKSCSDSSDTGGGGAAEVVVAARFCVSGGGVSSMAMEREESEQNLKATELRLGLPGARSPVRSALPVDELGSASASSSATSELCLLSTPRRAVVEKKLFPDCPGEENPLLEKYPFWAAPGNYQVKKRGFSEAMENRKVGFCGQWVFPGKPSPSPVAVPAGSADVEASKAKFKGQMASPKGVAPTWQGESAFGSVRGSLSGKGEAGCSKDVGAKDSQGQSQITAEAPVSKQQVVGWPPVRSFRCKTLATNPKPVDESERPGSNALYIKVSMDGAPYLRKVDLRMYSRYQELSSALEKMFRCFTIGQCGSHGIPGRDGLSESKLMDLLHGSEYVLTYEDKDGDWMLVGDVPWEMFVDSCKRLRIMKGSEAIGLAPRAMEKCKNRS